MTIAVKVQGGTNAGVRRVKQPARPWLCVQRHPNPGYATHCLTAGCSDRRP